MLKVVRIGLAAVLAIAVAPWTAHSAVIGVLGGDVDPELPLITNPGLFILTADGCGFEADSGFFCAAYEVPNSGDFPTDIDSIDFRITKPGGEFFTTDEIEGISVHGSSDLPFLTESFLFPDGITFRLSDSDSLNCGPVDTFCRADFYSVFDDVAAVSIVAVNDVPNVPEPVTLALLGVGAASVAARRYRRRLAARLN